MPGTYSKMVQTGQFAMKYSSAVEDILRDMVANITESEKVYNSITYARDIILAARQRYISTKAWLFGLNDMLASLNSFRNSEAQTKAASEANHKFAQFQQCRAAAEVHGRLLNDAEIEMGRGAVNSLNEVNTVAMNVLKEEVRIEDGIRQAEELMESAEGVVRKVEVAAHTLFKAFFADGGCLLRILSNCSGSSWRSGAQAPYRSRLGWSAGALDHVLSPHTGSFHLYITGECFALLFSTKSSHFATALPLLLSPSFLSQNVPHIQLAQTKIRLAETKALGSGELDENAREHISDTGDAAQEVIEDTKAKVLEYGMKAEKVMEELTKLEAEFMALVETMD